MNTAAFQAENALGNIANKVTPPCCEESGNPIRRLKWRLRETAGSLLPKGSIVRDGVLRTIAHRVGRCGRQVVGADVAVLSGPNGARYLNLETCGSVWLCPVCSAKIAEKRRGEVEEIVTRHVEGRRLRPVDQGAYQPYRYEEYQADKGAVYMLTLTIPHKAWDCLSTMRAAVADCWTRTVRGAPWARVKAKYGIAGVIRSMEVTYGKNGWHPHLHVLLLAGDLTQEQEDEFKTWLIERWGKFVEKAGLGQINHHGADFYRAQKIKEVGDYVAKWGCDSELTRWHLKKAAKGSRSPWQLLADAADGDLEARMKWREFASVFAGTRHITLSHGLRDLYLSAPELSDEEIAALEHGIEPEEIIKNTGEHIEGRFRRGLWVRIVTRNLAAEVLDKIDEGGWPAVLSFLADKGLALRSGIYDDGYAGENPRVWAVS